MSDLPHGERGQLLSGLAATLAALPQDRPHTWRLGEAMRRMVGADGVVITMAYLSDSRTTIVASDEVAEALENLQEVTGEGPGFEAATTGEIVVAHLDGASDQRWPMLSHAIEGRFGPMVVQAVPLRADGAPTGVATVYTRSRDALAEPPRRVGFLANAVGVALIVDAAERPESEAHATGSWGSRSAVHQATGMVMAQVYVTPEDALALLRGHAYALGTDVADVAERVVRREINVSRFDVEGD